MKNYFKVKNWDSFQHYKDRNPPWIKLHNHLLDNYEFECLPDASKAHLLCIWMLASRTQNKMPMDPEWIKRKIGASSKVNLEILVEYGFIEINQELPSAERHASITLVSEEKRRGETEKRQKRKGKTLLPSDFVITEEMKAWSIKNNLAIDINDSTEQWKDAMLAGGYKYTDWIAAWRNGMKNAQKWHIEKNPQAKTAGYQIPKGFD